MGMGSEDIVALVLGSPFVVLAVQWLKRQGWTANQKTAAMIGLAVVAAVVGSLVTGGFEFGGEDVTIDLVVNRFLSTAGLTQILYMALKNAPGPIG